jgi:hypothetical protein
VIAMIISWDAPLMSIAMKVPVALAADNTVVSKPSELTPFNGELFMGLLVEAGFPPGVMNLLPGTAEAGQRLVIHPLVKKVSFTGGLATAKPVVPGIGRQIREHRARRRGRPGRLRVHQRTLGRRGGRPGPRAAHPHAGARIDPRRRGGPVCTFVEAIKTTGARPTRGPCMPR